MISSRTKRKIWISLLLLFLIVLIVGWVAACTVILDERKAS